jgi:hypothetical protein
MKIGRNEPCPCGSGKKFKKCCCGKVEFKQSQNQQQQAQITLAKEIAKLQETAAKKEKAVRSLGVFIFLSTEEGDAWLLEITEMDGVQVADKGEKIDIDVEENPETIEINWTHRFAIRKKKFVTTAYADGAEIIRDEYPAHSIFAVIKRVRKKFPKELLSSIHINEKDMSMGKDD